MKNKTKSKLSTRLIAAVLPALLLAVGVTAAGSELAANADHEWVGTWSASLHEPDLHVPGLSNTGFNNQTLRQIVHISVGGRQVRVRFSTFGADALNIGAAHIALQAAAALTVPGSDRILTFGGKPTITIPPGALVLSDPVDLDVPALSNLAVSLFVAGATGPAAWHFESRQSMYVSSPGDFTAPTAMPVASTMAGWFWLAGVEVMSSRQTGAIVAVGDSITDGSQSTLDANNRWPDQLARRLIAQQGNQRLSVLNAGIAGGRILRDSLGPNALARFDRDVLSQTGITHVILQGGGNDIFTLNPTEDVTAEQVIQGLKQLIERAHAKGLQVYGCTLTPVQGFLIPGTPFSAYSFANEVKRQAVNAWIRTSGDYDAMFDFDRVLRDPTTPTRILPTLDSGDHGHPNDAGYKAMADLIDLKLFKNGRN